MANSSASNLNLSTESNQVGAEGAREIEITNQAAAARETEITNQAAADGAREIQITNQPAAARETEITNQAAAARETEITNQAAAARETEITNQAAAEGAGEIQITNQAAAARETEITNRAAAEAAREIDITNQAAAEAAREIDITNQAAAARETEITNRAAAEAAREIDITNQAAAARETEIINQAAAEGAREINITNQTAAEDGSPTHTTLMDPKLYVAAADGDIPVLEQYDDLRDQMTPKKITNQAAAEGASEIDITNQTAAEDGSSTHITFIDPKLYMDAVDGDIPVLEQDGDLRDQMTPKKITNQAAAEGGREIGITNQAAVEGAREIDITNQTTAEDGRPTHTTFMNPKLYVAAADGNIRVLEQYDDLRDQMTPKKNTVLHVAAQFGREDCVEWILGPLGSPSSLLQQPNEKGDTPLHLAAREGYSIVVQKLIAAARVLLERDAEKGAVEYWKEMLRMTNEEKNTALHEAVRYHHTKVVDLLIKEDPHHIYAANNEGNTPLYIAAEWGYEDLVRRILDNCTSPAHRGVKGRTALHAAVILNDRAMTQKILEWNRALTKELDEEGWSPLHFAAYVGCDLTIVSQLLDKSDSYVVYLGVKDHENMTALHIAASRDHVDIVKELVSRFPDCCEKVDDKGNNVLHLLMPKSVIFVTSGLSNIPWLRLKGLVNEKNVEGKTPLHLFEGVKGVTPESSETMLMWILDILARLMSRSRSSRVSIRPLGSLEIKEDSVSSKSEDSEEISELKKTMKSHMVVAALIATITFTAGFTLPGGYIQQENENQGLAVFSVPTMAIAVREVFTFFVVTDSIAMLLSLCAIVVYISLSFPIKNMNIVWACIWYGYLLTMTAMLTMVLAFVNALYTVLQYSSLLEDIFISLIACGLFFVVPCFLAMAPSPWWILYRKRVKSIKLM